MARVLIVDDDPQFRKMVHLSVEALGHEVVVVESARKGLQLLDEGRFDLVLTDIVMPDTDGLELIMTLRKEAPELKVIAMSGGARVNAKDYLAMAKRFGVVSTLEKPFKEGELAEAIAGALNSQG